MATLPSPDEVNLPGRVFFRTGVKSQISGAALRLGEGALTSDNWWGWLGDESQNPPAWPTSKTTGAFHWNYTPYFDAGLFTTQINGQSLADLFSSYITTGATPVLQIIKTNIVKTVYGAGADFADLTAAYAWLSQFTISSTGSVTLQLSAGQFTSSTSLNLSHRDGNRIYIRGAAPKNSAPATSSFQQTGSAPAQRASDNAANLALLRTIFATELNFTGGAGCYLSNGLGVFKDILISGDGTNAPPPSATYGLVTASGSFTIDNVAVVNFGYHNAYFYQSSINLINRLYAIGAINGYGVSLINTTFTINAATDPTINGIISLGNTQNGIDNNSNSLIACYTVGSYYSSIYTACNGTTGINVGFAGMAGNIRLSSVNNGGVGFSMVSGASVGLDYPVVTGNLGYAAIYVGQVSTCYLSHLTASGSQIGVYAFDGAIANITAPINISGTSTNYSPALNGGTGNNNALIHN